MRAARRGMIGYFVSNAPALMAPWGGVEPMLSNSPFAYAIPTMDEPIVLEAEFPIQEATPPPQPGTGSDSKPPASGTQPPSGGAAPAPGDVKK